MASSQIKNKVGEAPKVSHFIGALFGGAAVGLLALALLEALLILIGGSELLLWKTGWMTQAKLSDILKLLSTNDTAAGVRMLLVVLTALLGTGGGILHFFMHPSRRGWLTPWIDSVGLGISFLIMLAIVSIVGTIYELDDALLLVFDTWWFRLLLLLMAVNIGATTWKHLTKRVLPKLRTRVNKTPAVYNNARLSRQLAFTGSSEQLAKLLRRKRFRVAQEGDYLAGRKGVLNRFGSIISHTGFIIVLLGGFLTGLVGQEGTLDLIEGGPAAEHYYPRLSKSEIEKRQAAGQGYFEHEIKTLGFAIRCLDFKTGFFPQSQVRSTYTSTVEINDGKTSIVDIVEVNSSLRFAGLTFHQSSFGEAPGVARQVVEVTNRQTDETREVELSPDIAWPFADWNSSVRLVSNAEGMHCEILRDDTVIETHLLAQTDEYAFTIEVLDKATSEILTVRELDFNKPMPLLPMDDSTTTSLNISVERFVLDFAMGADRQVVSKSNEPNNPALKLSIMDQDQEIHRFWLFQRPEFRSFVMTPHEQYDFIFKSFTKIEVEKPEVAPDVSNQFAVRLLGQTLRQYTTLAVTSNPMIPLIYLGCLVMCLGLFFAFYWPTRTVLLWRQPDKGVVHAVAVYRDEQAEMTNDLERLFRAIEHAGQAD